MPEKTPWDWATHQLFGLKQNVAVITDAYAVESNQEIASDLSQDSSLEVPSESESDPEMTEQPIQEAQQPVVFPELDDWEPRFSNQEEILSEPWESFLPSMTETLAPLPSNPSLTEMLSNFPLVSSQAGNSTQPEPSVENEHQK